MPADNFQRRVLKIISENRDDDNVVAGGIALHEHGFRLSEDIDIFINSHRNIERMSVKDLSSLSKKGLSFKITKDFEGMREAIIFNEHEGSTRLQWVAAGSYHYFSPVKDPQVGRRLSFIDLAVNKTLAAGSRREIRDFMDLRFILTTGIPLWQLINGAAGKDTSITPQGLHNQIVRNSHFSHEEYGAIGIIPERINPETGMTRLRERLIKAGDHLRELPTSSHSGLIMTEKNRFPKEHPSTLCAIKNESIRKIVPQEGPLWPQGQDIDSYLIKKVIRGYGKSGEKIWR